MKFNIHLYSKGLKFFQAGRSCDSLRLSQVNDDLDSYLSSDYEEKGVRFNICEYLNMILYKQINPNAILRRNIY